MANTLAVSAVKQEFQKSTNFHEFRRMCLAYSDAHGIGSLEGSLLLDCFLVPMSGLYALGTIFYPPVSLEDQDFQYLGKYWNNGQAIIFVCRDGRTFISYGSWIVPTLHDLGYTEMLMLNPLDGVVEPDDLAQKVMWNETKKKSQKHQPQIVK